MSRNGKQSTVCVKRGRSQRTYTRKVEEVDWYDFPQYYDLAFRSETKSEVAFIEAACRRFGVQPTRRMLELACGTGRLLRTLAAKGYELTGIDLSEAALKYLSDRLKARGLKAELIHGDMARFQLARPVDAAFCTLNSFRHLLTEEQAVSHLKCVAEHLVPGGIYILGLHLIPTGVEESCIERWSVRHGTVQLTVTLRVLEMNWRKRLEKVRVSILVRTPQRERRLRSEFWLRLYRARHVRELLKKVPEFRLVEVFDFWYDIDDPVKFDNNLNDAVFVLRKEPKR